MISNTSIGCLNRTQCVEPDRFAVHSGHCPAGLLNDESGRGVIPRTQSKLEKELRAAGRDITEIKRSGSAAADVRTFTEIFEGEAEGFLRIFFVVRRGSENHDAVR